MYFEPGPSWQISVRDPFGLFFALYVGESLGALEHEGLPRLSAPVPHRAPDVPAEQLDALRAEWSGWWTGLLADRSRPADEVDEVDARACGSGTGPGLRDVQHALLSAARRWRDVNDWQGSGPWAETPGEVVRGIESRIGRRARPFTYSLDVLPVAGPYVHDVSTDRALISERQCSDPASLSAILRPRLEQLA